MSSWLAARLRERTSRGLRPLADGTATPAAMRRLSPAMRTMKNSSRLLAKIAAKRTRSSSGSASSCASSRTRALNAIHDSSRSRNRSCGSALSAGLNGRVDVELVGRGRRLEVGDGHVMSLHMSTLTGEDERGLNKTGDALPCRPCRSWPSWSATARGVTARSLLEAAAAGDQAPGRSAGRDRRPDARPRDAAPAAAPAHRGSRRRDPADPQGPGQRRRRARKLSSAATSRSAPSPTGRSTGPEGRSRCASTRRAG